jgi:hypothetical protein
MPDKTTRNKILQRVMPEISTGHGRPWPAASLVPKTPDRKQFRYADDFGVLAVLPGLTTCAT